ncbi:MAG: hypothetical protein WC708_10525 [Lentisphaeria bacterium]
MKKIMTVCGEIPPAQLGVTLPHEHIVCDLARLSGTPDNRLDDLAACKQEVAYFKRAGGGTIVDVTTPDIGRNAAALREISKATGIHLLACTGYYLEQTMREWVADKRIDQLAAQMIREITEGIGETGIKPGLIGELASADHWIRPLEERVLRAAARAQKETGLAISLHAAVGRPALDQLEILREEGAVLERVIVGHVDYEWHRRMFQDTDYYQKLLDAGCYLEFDQIGWGDAGMPEAERMKRILFLLGRGYGERLLLSSDLCRRSFYHQNGGRGYDNVITSFIEQLQTIGASPSQIRSMLIDAPARALAIS